MVPRSLRLTGEEDYPVREYLTGQRAPELGLTGGAIPEDKALRMQYRELMDEAATRTGCGGEGYPRILREAAIRPNPERMKVFALLPRLRELLQFYSDRWDAVRWRLRQAGEMPSEEIFQRAKGIIHFDRIAFNVRQGCRHALWRPSTPQHIRTCPKCWSPIVVEDPKKKKQRL